MLQLRLCVSIFTVWWCSCMLLAAAQTTNPAEVTALVAVKRSLVDPLEHLRNWNEGDPCLSNWTGVVCFDRTRADGYLHVRELVLMNLNISGSLAPELGQLSQLRILDFMWNDLTGSIPREIGNIESLKLLLLNGNKLSGSLPEELGNLSNLSRLQVDENCLSGPIPKSFENLSRIRHLHLNNNSICGQIPPEVSKLSTLLHLLLDNNNLSGYLPPEFSNFQDLRILQLDNNNFDGHEVPSSYGNISKLVKLSLRNCSLHGAVPNLSMIPNLSYLDLSWNQLTGSIPPNKLADRMTTIDLSHNNLNGSLPGSFSNLPSLQRLSLENNLLTGSVPASIWRNMSFTTAAGLMLDLRNNSLSSIFGELDPPANVSLRLQGNPICNNASTKNMVPFCGFVAGGDEQPESSTNSRMICPFQACPTDDFFEYAPSSPIPCFCVSPLRIGYRLKSPSFSFFTPYRSQFESYVTNSLKLNLSQLSIDSFAWDGPRLRMYLKLFPMICSDCSRTFNPSEVHRIRSIFTSWEFPGSDLFGPYELLNFTLLGPYANIIFETQKTSISKGILVTIILGVIVCAIIISVTTTFLTLRRHPRYKYMVSRKHQSSRNSIRIDGVRGCTFKEMALATDNFDSSTLVGRGGYGKVYKGKLSDNTIVAIKRAEEGSLQGQKEFLTEIELLSRLHHRNLVSLIGFCDEEEEQMLSFDTPPSKKYLSFHCLTRPNSRKKS